MGKHVLLLGIDAQWTMPDGSIGRAHELAQKSMSATNYTYKLLLLRNDDTSFSELRDTLQSDTQYDCISVGGGVQHNPDLYPKVTEQIKQYRPTVPIALPQRPNDVVSSLKEKIGE